MTRSKFDDLTDEQLLDAWRANERDAGVSLLKRHHASVARFFAHKLGPDTEDMVQATFLGLLEGLDRFRRESGFRTFLFAVARNQLLWTIRNRMRDRKRFDPSETSIAALDPSPSSVLAVKGQHKLLLAALRRLPIDIQIMLELHYWEGMAVKDIAQVLDMNPNTVKTHMKRGRAKLNEEMTALADSKEQLETTLRGLSRWAAQLRAELGEESES